MSSANNRSMKERKSITGCSTDISSLKSSTYESPSLKRKAPSTTMSSSTSSISNHKRPKRTRKASQQSAVAAQSNSSKKKLCKKSPPTTPAGGQTEKRCYMWESMYRHLVTYYKTNGNTLVPRSYETKGGAIKLGRWVDKQRQRKKLISEDRKKKLNEIGFVWSLQISWDDMYKRLLKFKEQHGHCLVPQKYSSDPKLGLWVTNQRMMKRQKGDLVDDRVEKLNSIGFVWILPTKSRKPFNDNDTGSTSVAGCDDKGGEEGEEEEEKISNDDDINNLIDEIVDSNNKIEATSNITHQASTITHHEEEALLSLSSQKQIGMEYEKTQKGNNKNCKQSLLQPAATPFSHPEVTKSSGAKKAYITKKIQSAFDKLYAKVQKAQAPQKGGEEASKNSNNCFIPAHPLPVMEGILPFGGIENNEFVPSLPPYNAVLPSNKAPAAANTTEATTTAATAPSVIQSPFSCISGPFNAVGVQHNGIPNTYHNSQQEQDTNSQKIGVQDTTTTPTPTKPAVLPPPSHIINKHKALVNALSMAQKCIKKSTENLSSIVDCSKDNNEVVCSSANTALQQQQLQSCFDMATAKESTAASPPSSGCCYTSSISSSPIDLASSLNHQSLTTSNHPHNPFYDDDPASSDDESAFNTLLESDEAYQNIEDYSVRIQNSLR